MNKRTVEDSLCNIRHPSGNKALWRSSAIGFDLFCIFSTGLKAPAATNHNTAKMTAASQTATKTASAASQGLVKQTSQYPLQRSGSARLSRLNSTGKNVRLFVSGVCS